MWSRLCAAAGGAGYGRVIDAMKRMATYTAGHCLLIRIKSMLKALTDAQLSSCQDWRQTWTCAAEQCWPGCTHFKGGNSLFSCSQVKLPWKLHRTAGPRGQGRVQLAGEERAQHFQPGGVLPNAQGHAQHLQPDQASHL